MKCLSTRRRRADRYAHRWTTRRTPIATAMERVEMLRRAIGRTWVIVAAAGELH